MNYLFVCKKNYSFKFCLIFFQEDLPAREPGPGGGIFKMNE